MKDTRFSMLRNENKNIANYTQESFDISLREDGELGQHEIENLGITEEELDQQCEELFDQTPIEFQPRKNSEMDQMI